MQMMIGHCQQPAFEYRGNLLVCRTGDQNSAELGCKRPSESGAPDRFGGMPSSHSSFVVSLAIGMARVEGYQSPLFAMTLVFAAVVMYDAMGVRRAAGEQAKTLNHLIGNFQDFFEFLKDHPLLDFDDEEFSADADDDMTGENRKVLKEFLGAHSAGGAGRRTAWHPDRDDLPPLSNEK